MLGELRKSSGAGGLSESSGSEEVATGSDLSDDDGLGESGGGSSGLQTLDLLATGVIVVDTFLDLCGSDGDGTGFGKLAESSTDVIDAVGGDLVVLAGLGEVGNNQALAGDDVILVAVEGLLGALDLLATETGKSIDVEVLGVTLLGLGTGSEDGVIGIGQATGAVGGILLEGLANILVGHCVPQNLLGEGENTGSELCLEGLALLVGLNGKVEEVLESTIAGDECLQSLKGDTGSETSLVGDHSVEGTIDRIVRGDSQTVQVTVDHTLGSEELDDGGEASARCLEGDDVTPGLDEGHNVLGLLGSLDDEVHNVGGVDSASLLVLEDEGELVFLVVTHGLLQGSLDFLGLVTAELAGDLAGACGEE